MAQSTKSVDLGWVFLHCMHFCPFWPFWTTKFQLRLTFNCDWLSTEINNRLRLTSTEINNWVRLTYNWDWQSTFNWFQLSTDIDFQLRLPFNWDWLSTEIDFQLRSTFNRDWLLTEIDIWLRWTIDILFQLSNFSRIYGD